MQDSEHEEWLKSQKGHASFPWKPQAPKKGDDDAPKKEGDTDEEDEDDDDEDEEESDA